MRYLRFTNWLTELDQLSGPIAAIWYEAGPATCGPTRATSTAV